MALRHIVTEGDEILRKTARPVAEVTERIKMTLEDMVETMRDSKGVGLAAPQIGVMRRMFVAEPEPDEVYFMVNPEILEAEGAVTDQEGCLSVPGYVGLVERPEKIKMKALDIDGNEQTYSFEGFHARVMCHEYDHLQGILYTDKAEEVCEIDELETEGLEEESAAEGNE